MNRLLIALGCLLVTAGSLLAQAAAPPASDNPTAGLDLGDAKPAGSTEAPSDFLAKFNHHLVVLDHGQTKPADPAALNGVKFVAFYYSAKWCPPCRAFSPTLVEFYNYFKKSHPNFELIFVSDDHSADDMLEYMKMDRMAWLAVQFDDIDSASLTAKKFQGPGIPCLVLVDSTGKVLADSFVDGHYVGPQEVVEQIKKMVPEPGPVTARL